MAWMTFTYTGCSGAISPSDDIRLVWRDLPNLGGESLRVPVIHGAYEIVPLDWEGETLREYVSSPDYSDPVETDDITVARTLDFWREPTLPEGWTFNKAIAAGGDAYGGASYGYCATWWATDRIIPEANYAHPQMGVEICADFTSSRYGNRDASWNEGSAAHETRVIAGRPAVLRFSPPAPNHHPSFPTLIEVFDPATEVTYEIEAIDYDLRSNPEAVVEMARSLFTPAPPATSATTFRYGTYDTTGAVSTPGSHAFLTDTSDLTSTTDRAGLASARAILVNVLDSFGASQATHYDGVGVGDVVEWFPVGNPECWERYKITEILPDPPGDTPRKLFAVEQLYVFLSECPARDIADIVAQEDVELRWNPPAGRPGCDGIPTMLQDQAVPGGATYRAAPHENLVIDIPHGMTVVRLTGFVAASVQPLRLEDVESGSLLLMNLGTGEEWKRTIVTSEDDSRDVGALFDQIVASARTVVESCSD